MKKTKIILTDSTSASFAFDWLGNFVKVLSIVLLMATFVFRIAVVDGHSMETTLIDTDRVIVTDLFYTPRSGDIVIISRGAQLDKPLVKRVIAVAGQELCIDYENDAVYVDGEKLDEPYIQGRTIREDNPPEVLNGVIPEGKVFVMGDNREHSTDSRSTLVDMIDVDHIIGKVQLDVVPHAYEDGELKLDLGKIRSVYND